MALAFKDMEQASQIRDYLRDVLSRTGGKSTNEVYLYHYTSLSAVLSILESRSMWLSPTSSMNDHFESALIQRVMGNKDLYFSCFSRTEECLAMYKMYTPEFGGAMLAIPFSAARQTIQSIPTSDSGRSLVVIVRNGQPLCTLAEANVYWSGVCYKGLHSDTLRAGTVWNSKIKKPLHEPELAGCAKLNGWEYEQEVRLCAVPFSTLLPGDKISVPLPSNIADEVRIVLGPSFKRQEHKDEITQLMAMGVSIVNSAYDGLVDL